MKLNLKHLTTINLTLFLLFSCSEKQRFISEKQNLKNIKSQKAINKTMLQELSKYGVTDTTELKLEFFFYTNAEESAAQLADALKKMNYNVRKSDTLGNQWTVKGWSTKIQMSITKVNTWTTLMCKTGFTYDCSFHGWGTDPDQNIVIEENLSFAQYKEKAKAAYTNNELRKSELYLTQMIRLQPDTSKHYFNRGTIRMTLGNTKQAVEDYEKAIAIQPAFKNAYINLAAIKDEAGDYTSAVKYLTEAIELDPTDPMPLANRGGSKYNLDDVTGACEDWNKALQLGDTSMRSTIRQYCK